MVLKEWAARRAARIETRVWRGVRAQLRAGERPIDYLTCDMPGSWLKGYVFAAIVPADDEPRAFNIGYREEWAPEDIQVYGFVVARSSEPLIGTWFNALRPAWNASRAAPGPAEVN
jgi:hypothetical protein